jgi:hypothetical protein
MGGGKTTETVGKGLGTIFPGSRLFKGKSWIGKDIKDLFKSPEVEIPEIPEPPESGTAAERARARAIAERLRLAAFTGTGRKATIATSARGIQKPTPTIKSVLTGI